MKKAIVIGIAGGTGSGKTSIAQAILEDLKKGGAEALLLEQDSYYIKNDEMPFEERVKLNYDHPDVIDFELLEKHIIDLKNGNTIEKPIYNFSEYNRCKETEIIESKPIIIVEGILILSVPKIRELLDMKIFVDDDERLLRRMERDIQERGRSFENIKNQYIKTVKPMHLEFVEPSKRYADVIIPRGKENEIGIKMVSSRLRYLIRKNTL